MSADVHQTYVPRLLDSWPEAEVYQRVMGTMVFVDISGFTAMSERLAKRGRVGAEEVVSVLNTVFTELLTVAHSYGGDLLKFGGDALLLLFQGDDHARRGCRAASLMRHRLRSVGRLKTSAGNVHLKMSTGVNTGAFDLFVVGDHHLDLLPVGPAVSGVVALESAATGGEIMISPTTAAELPKSAVGRKTSSGFLLAKAPPANEVLTERSDELDSLKFIPELLQAAVSTSKEGEHRRVSIAFIHLDNTDDMVRELGSDGAAQQLNQVIQLTQQVAHQLGVVYLATDIDDNGLKVILCTGAPRATANDEERLLRAVREIGDHAPVPIRIGVHRGPVFVGNVGAPFRKTYTIIGDAVNLSARVMAHARPGQILATKEVLGFSDTLFEQFAIEPFYVKGKTDEVSAVAIGAVSGTRARTATTEFPLVGRQGELASLSMLSTSAAAGSGGTVEISGIAGIGKSRLVRTASQRVDALQWRTWACERYEQATPFFAWRKIVRTLIGSQRADDPRVAGNKMIEALKSRAPQLVPWAPLLAIAADADVGTTPQVERLDAKFRTSRLHEVVVEFLTAAIDGPTALVIEEGQWLDPASNDLAAAVTRQIDKHRLLLVIVRSDESTLHKAGAASIHLEELDEESALELARHATESSPIPNERLQRLAMESGGNPMFLLALAANASSSDALPDTIEASVTADLDRLDPDIRRVLRFASVIGSIFDPNLLQRVSHDLLDNADSEEVWQRLGDFLEKMPDGRLRFRQTITRDVAYETLPFALRQRIHGEVGEALELEMANEHDDQAELLSLHFSRARRFDKAWQYAVIAGDRGLSKYANVAAAQFYAYALEAGKHVAGIDPHDQARIAEARSDALELAGDYAAASVTLSVARKHLTSEDAALQRLMRKEGIVRMRLGKYRAALTWLTRALNVQTADAEAEAELSVAYAAVRFRQGKWQDCIDWAERGLRAAIESGNKSTIAHAYSLLSVSTFEAGTTDDDYASRALAIYEEMDDHVGQADVLNNIGYRAYFEGRWDDALQEWNKARRQRELAGDAMGASVAENNVAEILSDQGRWDEAEPMFKEVIRASRAARSWHEWVATANLGRLETRRGNTDLGADLLKSALTQFELTGSSGYALETRTRIVQNLAQAGKSREAVDAAENLLTELADVPGTGAVQAGVNRAYGSALIQLGEHAKARVALETSLHQGRESAAGFEIALTLKALSRWADAAGAVDEWRAEAAKRTKSLGIIETASIPAVVLHDAPPSSR